MKRILSYFILFGIVVVMATYSANTVDAELSYDDKVEFATMMEQIEGHIFVATENKHAKQYDLAKIHMAHPIEKQYDELKKHLDGNNEYAKKLGLVLSILKNSNLEINEKDFDESLSQISQVIQTGESLIIGDVVDDPVFKMHVIISLLKESKQNYVNWTESESDFRTIQIQDSYGFAVRSNSLFSTLDTLATDDELSIAKKFIKIYRGYGDKVTSSEMIQLQDELVENIQTMIVKLQNSTDASADSFTGEMMYVESNSLFLSKLLNNQITPNWLENNVQWLNDEQITEKEFYTGILFLTQNGIIPIHQK